MVRSLQLDDVWPSYRRRRRAWFARSFVQLIVKGFVQKTSRTFRSSTVTITLAAKLFYLPPDKDVPATRHGMTGVPPPNCRRLPVTRRRLPVATTMAASQRKIEKIATQVSWGNNTGNNVYLQAAVIVWAGCSSQSSFLLRLQLRYTLARKRHCRYSTVTNNTHATAWHKKHVYQ